MSGKSKPPAVNSSKIGSGLSPCVAAVGIAQQTDVNDRAIWLQGCR